MPLYAYRCNNCGHEFEVRQRFSEDPLTDCPQCDGPVRRVISKVGVVFKGSGFYVTDNRNGKANSYLNSGKGEGAAGDGAKSDSASGDGAKSDGAKSDGVKSDGTKGDGKADSGSAPLKDSSGRQKPAASAS